MISKFRDSQEWEDPVLADAQHSCSQQMVEEARKDGLLEL